MLTSSQIQTKDQIFLYRNYDKIHVNKYGCAEGEAIVSGQVCFIRLKNGRCFLASYYSIIKKLSEN